MKWLPDPWLTTLYLLASIFSAVVMTSISPERVMQHMIMLATGFVLYLYLGNQDSGIYKSFGSLAYVITLILLLLTALLSDPVRGSASWIRIGEFQFQAGEVAKPLLIIAFASFLHQFKVSKFKNLLINTGLFILPTFLIFRQPDLGTALVIAAIWIAQIFVSGISYLLIATVALASLVGATYLPHVLQDYQLRRLETFIDPHADPLGSGYNVIQSIIAVGSGGILGKGLGHGTQSHLRFLPERHTDFIFASLSEELGLLGSLIIITILSGIIYRLLHVLTTTNDAMTRSILAGIVGYLTFQTFINIGMNIGIAPVTGVTLPLISYGGTSVIATAISLGIAASMIRGESQRRLLEIR